MNVWQPLALPSQSSRQSLLLPPALTLLLYHSPTPSPHPTPSLTKLLLFLRAECPKTNGMQKLTELQLWLWFWFFSSPLYFSLLLFGVSLVLPLGFFGIFASLNAPVCRPARTRNLIWGDLESWVVLAPLLQDFLLPLHLFLFVLLLLLLLLLAAKQLTFVAVAIVLRPLQQC